jgi:hypothetical protein
MCVDDKVMLWGILAICASRRVIGKAMAMMIVAM